MLKRFGQVIVVALAMLTLWSGAAQAQERGAAAPAQGRGGAGRGGRGPQAGFIAAGVPAMPDPPGPAPKRDFTGTWVGPIKIEMGPYAPMTPAGQAAFKQ